jgi:hypothetical protein
VTIPTDPGTVLTDPATIPTDTETITPNLGTAPTNTGTTFHQIYSTSSWSEKDPISNISRYIQ